MVIHYSYQDQYCFVLETNTGDVRGFLLVQHYWGVNKVLNLGIRKLQTISVWNWSHHVPTTNQHLSWEAKMNETQRKTLVSPWRMYCMDSRRYLSGWRNIEAQKNLPCSLSHFRVMWVWIKTRQWLRLWGWFLSLFDITSTWEVLLPYHYT